MHHAVRSDNSGIDTLPVENPHHPTRRLDAVLSGLSHEVIKEVVSHNSERDTRRINQVVGVILEPERTGLTRHDLLRLDHEPTKTLALVVIVTNHRALEQAGKIAVREDFHDVSWLALIPAAT